METIDAIEQALKLLDTAGTDSTCPPAMVVMPPDAGSFILGNRDGFVCLAVASSRAAQGKEQSFRGKPWVSIQDFDWGLAGLKPDKSAHLYLPASRTRFSKVVRSMVGLSLLLSTMLCLVIGLYHIVLCILR